MQARQSDPACVKSSRTYSVQGWGWGGVAGIIVVDVINAAAAAMMIDLIFDQAGRSMLMFVPPRIISFHEMGPSYSPAPAY